jgi:hypothetical protein
VILSRFLSASSLSSSVSIFKIIVSASML